MPINDDVNCNNSTNPHFQDVLQEALKNPSRRNILRGGLGLASMFALPMLPGCGGASTTNAVANLSSSSVLGFNAVTKSILDQVVVPSGYTVKVLHATGDRLVSGIDAYSNTGAETDDWSQRVGDHHDGMDIYYVDSAGRYSAAATSRAVLAVNHESSADSHFLHLRGQTSAGVNGKKFSQFGEWDLGARPGLEVLKEINLHGISVAEVSLDSAGKPTGYVVDSSLNRRITPQTVVDVQGPAAHLTAIRNMFVTRFDTTGATSRGTLNNCGHGKTPWGTYLGCEENWATYFNMPTGSTLPDAKTIASRKRYGVSSAALSSTDLKGAGQGWYTPTDLADTEARFTRWNVAASGTSASLDFRNEPNTFGYILEVDPLNPSARPAKRTALGRFAHEAAVCGTPVVGKPLAFYMGCDSRNEYIYKFVSTANWDAADIGGGMAAGDKYLNEGKLYVAKFNSTGAGEWIELSFSNTLISGFKVSPTDTSTFFANQAEIYVHTRLAADAVGATKMDRPEWGAVNPANGEIYFALTNNSASNRTPAKADAANPRSYNDADGKVSSGNPNGHIIRFKEQDSLSTALSFNWDIYVFGAEEDMPADVNISKLTAANSFSSPDGLWFSKSTGICWIQTDDGAFTDETNCMLLASVPGTVGDGGEFYVNNSLTTGSGTTAATTTSITKTFIGGVLGESRLRRFLVAPKGAEVTGITETADGKTLFVNIQHPGENTAAWGATATTLTTESTWPGNGGGLAAAYGVAGRPRSATLVITKNDGGKIGL
jgi:secreted PhoX family phosphatase